MASSITSTPPQTDSLLRIHHYIPILTFRRRLKCHLELDRALGAGRLRKASKRLVHFSKLVRCFSGSKHLRLKIARLATFSSFRRRIRFWKRSCLNLKQRSRAHSFLGRIWHLRLEVQLNAHKRILGMASPCWIYEES